MEFNIFSLKGLLFFCCIICIAIFFNSIINLFRAITYYFNSKADHEQIISSRILSDKSPEMESVGDIVNNTTDILVLCKSLIEVQIENQMNEVITLHQRYEMQNLDTDAKEIAQAVYEALDQDILINKTFILKKEFILKYISSESLLMLISRTKEYNSSFINNSDTN